MNMGLQSSVILLSLLAVITNSAYSGNNVIIIRKIDFSDIFTKPSSADCKKFVANNDADRCRCTWGSNTFMVKRGKCASNADVLKQMRIKAFAAVKVQGEWVAAYDSSFFTFDITSGKQRLFEIPQWNRWFSQSNIPCKTAAKHLNETTEKWIEPTAIAERFEANITKQGDDNPKISFKWSAIQEKEFHGSILRIDVKCSTVTGHIIFKTVGSKTWPMYLSTTAPTEISSFGTSNSPRTSDSTTVKPSSPSQIPRSGTSGKMGGENGKNTLTVIVPVVFGIILSVILICVFVWFMIRKRRKRERNTPCDNVENSENPTYGRGPDNVMTTNKKSNKNIEEDTNYQPIVQNTRASGQPTYEAPSGNKQRQPPQNPSIYQALNPDKPAPVQQQSNYEPLVRHRNPHHKDLPHEGESSHESQGDTERDYAVLEGPSEGTDRAEAPVYQVPEQGQEKGSPQENNHDEPVYNVLEAE